LDEETTSSSSSSSINSLLLHTPPFRKDKYRESPSILKGSFLKSSKSSSSVSLNSLNLQAKPLVVEEQQAQPQIADTSLTYYDDFYVGSKFNRMRKLDSTWTTNNVSKNSSDLHLKYESSLQSSKTDRSTLRQQMRERKERELSQLRSSSDSDLSTSKKNTAIFKNKRCDNFKPTKRPFSCNLRSSTRKAHVDLNMASDLDEYETLNKFNKLERFKQAQKLMRIQQLHLKQSSFSCMKEANTNQPCFNSTLNSQPFHINRLDDCLLVKIFARLDTIQILALQFV